MKRKHEEIFKINDESEKTLNFIHKFEEELLLISRKKNNEIIQKQTEELIYSFNSKLNLEISQQVFKLKSLKDKEEIQNIFDEIQNPLTLLKKILPTNKDLFKKIEYKNKDSRLESDFKSDSDANSNKNSNLKNEDGYNSESSENSEASSIMECDLIDILTKFKKDDPFVEFCLSFSKVINKKLEFIEILEKNETYNSFNTEKDIVTEFSNRDFEIDNWFPPTSENFFIIEFIPLTFIIRFSIFLRKNLFIIKLYFFKYLNYLKKIHCLRYFHLKKKKL